MKKILLFSSLLLLTITLLGQAKKPTIMIVPSDVWCNQNGFMTTFDNMGTTQKIPNYKDALQSDPNLLLVISTINNLMADRGFPLKNLESTLKSIEQRTAEDNMTTSKSGSELAESPLDRLKRVAKADIIMQLTWTINTTGPKKSVIGMDVDSSLKRFVTGYPEKYKVASGDSILDAVIFDINEDTCKVQEITRIKG